MIDFIIRNNKNTIKISLIFESKYSTKTCKIFKIFYF